MNILIFFFSFISYNLFAGPMEEMKIRQQTHAALMNLQCQSVDGLKDEGLVFDITCDLTCFGKDKKTLTITNDFLPRKLGLKQGNGSAENNIIWASLGLTLKRWSNEICLKKADEVCGGYDNIADSNVSLLASGEWKLEKLPGCKESKSTLSPFDESSKSKKIEGLPLKLLSDSFISPSSLLQENDPVASSRGIFSEIVSKIVKGIPSSQGNCSRPIEAQICYGDCIDLQVETNVVETLGTSQPLGQDVEKICGDHLYSYFQNKKLTPMMKKKYCEEFFWLVYTNHHGLKSNRMTSTCAALRGDIDCSNLID